MATVRLASASSSATSGAAGSQSDSGAEVEFVADGTSDALSLDSAYVSRSGVAEVGAAARRRMMMNDLYGVD